MPTSYKLSPARTAVLGGTNNAVPSLMKLSPSSSKNDVSKANLSRNSLGVVFGPKFDYAERCFLTNSL
jgi:hypothetical protein